MKKQLIGIGLSMSLLAGCGSSAAGSNEADVRVGAESERGPGVTPDGIDPSGTVQDKEWKLESITGVGQSALRGEFEKTQRNDIDAGVYRFNFDLGGTAVSCLVATDANEDFPSAGYLDPGLCFINGNIRTPLSGLNKDTNADLRP